MSTADATAETVDPPPADEAYRETTPDTSTGQDAPRSDRESGSDADEDSGTDGSTKAQKHSGTDNDRSSKKIADVINVFQEQVSTGTIGTGRGGGGGERHRTTFRTGKLDETEFKQDLTSYCRPSVYDKALGYLYDDHVVAVYGTTGIGKRAGALNLLREVTDGQLVMMSAVTDLKELANRTYQAEFGYLIVDWIDTTPAKDADFNWRTLRDRVRKAGAFLVVTTTAANHHEVRAVRHFEWERPDLRSTLRGYLNGAAVPPDAIDEIVSLVGEDYSMSDLAALARTIVEDGDYSTALRRFVETSARCVRQWFDSGPDAAHLLDAAALAFLSGATPQEFEDCRELLDTAMARHNVVKAAKKSKAHKLSEHLPIRRQLRVRDDGIITERRVAGLSSTRRALEFRHPTYLRYVLSELSERFEQKFWNAMHEWLAALISSHPDVRVARGLALLAVEDFDEVERSYLTPWSRGYCGTAGQVTAVYVVWYMCFVEATVPVALKVAKRWANHGDPEQRWVAAMIYSGELGACDPTQSIKQLWHLIVQSSVGYEQACFAMAALFETLVGGTDDAGKLLTTLEKQLDRGVVRENDAKIVDRAKRVLAELLVARGNHQVPVTFLYLKKYPDRIESVARLWARAICNRLYRKTVLEALWDGLSRLGQITETPMVLAADFGRALVKALPEDEVDQFQEHLHLIDERKRRRTKSSESMAQVLLDVIKKYFRRKKR